MLSEREACIRNLRAIGPRSELPATLHVAAEALATAEAREAELQQEVERLREELQELEQCFDEANEHIVEYIDEIEWLRTALQTIVDRHDSLSKPGSREAVITSMSTLAAIARDALAAEKVKGGGDGQCQG